MSIKDDLAPLLNPVNCGLCRATADMPEDDREAIEQAIRGTIGVETISKILRANGYDVAHRQVRKHRLEGH
jgi:hypothetical protein